MRTLPAGLLFIVLAAGCTRAVYQPALFRPTAVPDPASADGQLKVHLHSGDLVVLRQWAETDTALVGVGTRYGPVREVTGRGSGSIVLPFDSIALLEMQVRRGSRPTGVVGMAIWSVLWGSITIYCVADPKACFGSCPTFYVATDSGEALAAEGFSASIARALEARDLDALVPARTASGAFTVTMRNEALETHAVRRLRLVAARRPLVGRVFAGPDNRLYPATALSEPLTCRAAEGDCVAALRTRDGVERTSPADSTDLAARETLELSFPPARGSMGLVLGARQSLLTTYLFYQTMGFLGRRAGAPPSQAPRHGTRPGRPPHAPMFERIPPEH